MVDEPGRGRTAFALFVMGLGAILAQILLIRELMVVFSGNELSAGVMLAAWLLWTGLGSALLGIFSDAIRRKSLFFATVQLVLALVLPSSLLLVRYLRTLLGVLAGEIASLPQMVIGTFSLLGPFCIASGFLFALGCSLLGESMGKEARAVGAVYVYEALGATLGGVAFGYALIDLLNPWQVALVTACTLCVGSVVLSGRVWPFACLLLSLSIGALTFLGESVNLVSRGWPWKGYTVKASVDTKYGTITVIDDGRQVSFFENGVWNFTYPDPLTAEEAVHFALLEHPKPHRVLLIGGGVGGLLGEILKHPSLQHVDYVELDPQLVATGRRYLSPEATAALDDYRVRIVHSDGRRFVQRGSGTYDVMIIHLPDPTTAQINRCYTREFFAEAKRVLRKDGLVYLAVNSSENVIGHTLAQFLSSVYRTMMGEFPELLVLPGAAAKFLGARSVGILVSDPNVLVQRAQGRGLDLRYVREYYILDNLSPERIDYIQTILGQETANINRDLRPICYFYNIVLWSAQYSPWIKTWFIQMLPMRVEWVGVLLAVITLILLWRGRRSRSSVPLLWAVLITGFSEIALEIMLILAFQILYGYVYYKIGMIITAYMIGLALGGWMMVRVLGQVRRPVRLLFVVQSGLTAYAFGILMLVVGLHRGGFPVPLADVLEVLFPFLTLLAGFFGGAHFPLASKIYLRKRMDIGRVGGLFNGVDLIGSAAGALVISVVLVPILGIVRGFYVIIALNLSALVILRMSTIWKEMLRQ